MTVKSILARLLMVALALGGLALVFLFQDVDPLALLFDDSFHPYTHFIVKKFLRVTFNDTFMLLLLYAWFFERQIVKLALALQMIDMFILLPVYLTLKLYVEGQTEISHPLFSQLHRLIVNPTLLILVVPAIYFQRYRLSA